MDKLENVRGRIYHTESFGAVDGPGIRYVFFLQGCNLRCLYCHNPDALPFSGGEIWTAGEVVAETLRYKNFIKSGGVTLSGGEPLVQPEFVFAVTKLLHQEGIHVAIDTSGAEPLERTREAIDEADLLLLDIKAIDNDLSVKLCGQGNAGTFETLDYCEKIGKPVWIRHVLLQGYTLDEDMLKRLAQRLIEYSCIERVELLPFHKMGEVKWRATNLNYKLYDTPATTPEELDSAKDIFRENGFLNI